jgi:genome maintenance exonuclease 1
MSLITEKYEYKKMSRSILEGRRVYETPDGNKLASVTTILDDTKDKTHLNKWRKKVGHEKAKEITAEATTVGTSMHKHLEHYVLNGEWKRPGTNPYHQQAFKMAQTIYDNGLKDLNEIWGSEVGLYFPKIYAGTTDILGEYKGTPCIVDFKQSNKPKRTEWVTDYYLQLVAYAEAHNEVYGTNINEGHVFLCTRDLKYQQFDITPENYNDYKDMWWKRVEQYYIKHNN